METYGKILLIAMPAFLALVLFENLYGRQKGSPVGGQLDTIASLSSGITNVTKSVLELTIAIGIYPFMLRHFALLHITQSWLLFVLTFIILDFNGYWIHRWSHRVNLFWNLHVIHHSSEEFNLACALRQSISAFFNLFSVLLLPAALLGIPPVVIATVAPLHLFAQFWYHTRLIDKMGWLEHVLVTPSHHRVHHAINPEYMDKNLSQIFIVWDKLFGTFAEEKKEVPPVYGITRPARTFNPVRINFQHLWLLLSDAWRTQHLLEKLRLWFMPTGYRPADVAARYPVYKIDDVYHFQKYDRPASRLFIAWAWFQLAVLLIMISYLFGNIAYINSLDSTYIYLYGALVFLSVVALTELMDHHPKALYWELLKCLTGLGLLKWQGDWFGSSLYWQEAPMTVLLYFIVSMLITGAWWQQQRKQLTASTPH